MAKNYSKKAPRVHCADIGGDCAICGHWSRKVTDQLDQVTCKACLKSMAKTPPPTAADRAERERQVELSTLKNEIHNLKYKLQNSDMQYEALQKDYSHLEKKYVQVLERLLGVTKPDFNPFPFLCNNR